MLSAGYVLQMDVSCAQIDFGNVSLVFPFQNLRGSTDGRMSARKDNGESNYYDSGALENCRMWWVSCMESVCLGWYVYVSNTCHSDPMDVSRVMIAACDRCTLTNESHVSPRERTSVLAKGPQSRRTNHP